MIWLFVSSVAIAYFALGWGLKPSEYEQLVARVWRRYHGKRPAGMATIIYPPEKWT